MKCGRSTLILWTQKQNNACNGSCTIHKIHSITQQIISWNTNIGMILRMMSKISWSPRFVSINKPFKDELRKKYIKYSMKYRNRIKSISRRSSYSSDENVYWHPSLQTWSINRSKKRQSYWI